MDWETPQIADGKIFRTMILSPRCREVLGKTSWVGHVVPSRKIKDGNKVQKNVTTCFSPLKKGGSPFWDGGHIRPYPKRGQIRPYPTILPIDCVIQPFSVRPGEKGLLWGTGQHLGGTWGRSLSHFPHY
jgi:hypothetical protein